SSEGFLMVVGFVSRDGKLTAYELADYVKSSLDDVLRRVPGVGQTQVFGAYHSMRIWLNPEKLQKYALMPSDVESAITAQN
ncbi:efflux RND transporter permease subunit, partial [Mycobacterium tuberculosis]|nr:efflux RND transporter permease subunit [Mycobacterium tuberculosis]